MPSHSDGNIPQRLAEDTAESKGQIGPDDLMENALQTLLLRTADFEKKLAELSTKIDSALTNSKTSDPGLPGDKQVPLSKGGTNVPTFLDVAKAYDNQLKKLKSENDRLHAVVQKPLDPGEALRDDELVHRFESLRRCIEKACRDNTRKVARDVNFDVQLKTIAVLTEHIHRHIYEMPYFGMKVTIEDGLRGFEEDLFSKLGDDVRVSEWRSTTLHLAKELEADFRPNLASIVEHGIEKLHKLQLVSVNDSVRFHRDLVGIYEMAEDTIMMLRQSKHLYVWDQEGRIKLDRIAWTEFANHFEPDLDPRRTGKHRSRVLFGPLLKRVDNSWAVIRRGEKLVPIYEE